MADKIRLGLIGASVRGTWSARSHLPAVRASSDVDLTAVCTTRADSAEAACRAWGARLAFDDWRKMIASPEIDAVAVVVRVPSHYAPTNAALEAGKHVYCEWPIGRTTAEAVELAALAEAKGPAGPRQSCLDAHEGTGRGRLCRRSDGRPRPPDARGRVVPAVAPHLAARRRARRQH